MSSRLEYAVFDDESRFKAAIARCRTLHLSVVDAWTPYPLHGIEELMGVRPTRLPWVTLIAGAIGLGLAMWFQYWSSAQDWPLNIGGKPFDSLPAFIPVAFELLILFGGLATAFALFVRCGLWPGKRAKVIDPRVSDDRFALLVERRDSSLNDQEIAELWREHGALRAWSEVQG